MVGGGSRTISRHRNRLDTTVTIEMREDYDDDQRIDATLPPFRNFSPCPTCQRFKPGGMLRYCPGCDRIRGSHFHQGCPCGATWEER
jgi:hypothetical protein